MALGQRQIILGGGRVRRPEHLPVCSHLRLLTYLNRLLRRSDLGLCCLAEHVTRLGKMAIVDL